MHANIENFRYFLLQLPGKGDLVAFDGEFVSVEAARTAVNAEGKRVARSVGRQFLARISVIDQAKEVLVDDYVLPTETVVDYLTRFSGIVEDDLSAATSRHPLVQNRTAIMKLRYFVDAGCIFVGHGLQKDFETANLFVPPDQIKDTVELWRLPDKRKISLKFLAAYILGADIQDEVHDSIEDAKTALALYEHYVKLREEGEEKLQAKIQALYALGSQNNWMIGLDRIEER